MTKDSTTSAKERVLAWVRSKNPASMELKFGCKILVSELLCTNNAFDVIPKSSKSLCTILSYSAAYKENTPSSTDWNDEAISVWCDEWHVERTWGGEDLEESDGYEILGSDMGLQELLIALKTRDISIESCGALMDSIYDLTKNLHNQDDSFYEALLPLIK